MTPDAPAIAQVVALMTAGALLMLALVCGAAAAYALAVGQKTVDDLFDKDWSLW